MLNRFKNLHNKLNLLKTAYPELDNNYPDEEEWKTINNIIFLLEPMLHATEILSTSSYPTIADVRLTFLGIIRHLELFINNNLYSKNEQTMAYFIKNKLNDYWSIINQDESTKIALVLDPTSKLITFPLLTEKDTVLISLRNIMNQYKPLALTSTSVFDDKRKWFVSLISQQTIIPQLAEELELYLSTPPISSSIQN
ncbi:1682_t:CDS:1, partial [Cetraspora pellucida]